MKPTKLKYIEFEWDEENRELLITQDKITMAIPYRNLYSLRVYIARIYRKYLGIGLKKK